MKQKIFLSLIVGAAGSLLALGSPAMAQGAAPSTATLITEDVLQNVREMLDSPVVSLSLKAENEKRKEISQQEIDALDQAWRAEKDSDGPQPLIAAAMGSPVSTYLLRQQASSKGLYNEIFVMDLSGLNVGQSSITSDYWQGDEAKVQKTLPQGAGGIFIDEPEYMAETGIWVAQVNLVLSDGGEVVGVSTVEINLTELERRSELGLS